VLALVQNGDGGEFFHVVKLSTAGEWKRLTTYVDRIVQLDWTPAGDLIAISRLGAPRGKLLLLSQPDYRLAQARTIVRSGQDVLVHDHYGSRTLIAAKDRIFVTVQTGGPSAIRVYDYRGKALPAPKQLPVASVSSLVPVGETDLLFHTGSYFQPTRGRIFHAQKATAQDTALGSRAQEDFSDFEAVREFARSKDGTRVPVNILRRKGLKLDGSHPAVATGYGGYGISSQPVYNRPLKALLEAGVVYAIANLRGGGEYGEEWHEAGRLLRKQNVFDDFEAALRHLIGRGYTSPKRLGVVGGSNGGLLIGALVTQHPELVRAAVIDVGLLDMLRVELTPNGAFNTVEYGTVKEKAFFDVLYSYSPYHRVRDGVRYPSVLLTTGLNDGRVEAWHSLKMAARLQAASPSDLPILLNVMGDAGHGPGMRLSTRIDFLAERFSFLLAQLGVPRQN
jgi:prolyl oligopeptidase